MKVRDSVWTAFTFGTTVGPRPLTSRLTRPSTVSTNRNVSAVWVCWVGSV